MRQTGPTAKGSDVFSPRVTCMNAATSAKRDVLVNSAAQGTHRPCDGPRSVSSPTGIRRPHNAA